MNIFLNFLSDIIIKRYSENKNNITVIVPNKRAKLFLKTIIAKKISQPIWMPVFITIEEFIFNLAKTNKADNTELLFDLYAVYQEKAIKNISTFTDFMEWGPELLSDINEIDNQLIDAENIFSFLSDYKKIDQWDIEVTELTNSQLEFIKFYESIYEIYTELKKVLNEKNIAYPGMAARNVAEHINNPDSISSTNHLIFAGLNALSKSEQLIVDTLIKDGYAETVWDAEQYFMDNIEQEAGIFLRKEYNLQNKDFKQIFDNSNKIEKIDIIGCSQNIYQAKIVGNIIKEYSEQQIDLNSTAIILFDENMLIPLLNSLPEQIKDYNITMGYNMIYSPLYDLLQILFDIKKNYLFIKKTFIENRISNQVYTSDLIKLKNNPIFIKIINNQNFDSLIDNLKKSNIIITTQDKIIENSPQDNQTINLIFDFITFENEIDITTINNLLSNIFKHIENKIINDLNKITTDEDARFFSILTEIFNNITESVTTHQDIHIDYKAYIKIVTRALKDKKISFYGEPLTGLQIMGILETRALDFDNLIMVSMNEGNIPQNISQSSFIPADIKKIFGFPTLQEKTSIYAYYFYRLILKAKKIHLIYNAATESSSSGTKSRYILQIINELSSRMKKIEIKQYIVTPKDTTASTKITFIDKNQTIIDKLEQIAESGFSPSAINTYINCKLQYFYKYIANINEDKELTGIYESDIIGNVIHKLMKDLYETEVGKYLNKQLIERIASSLQSKLESILKSEFDTGTLDTGKNLLIKEVMLLYMKNYFKYEINNLNEKNKILIKSIETPLSYTLKKGIKIKGIPDRIDNYNGETRITDYKTGITQPYDLKLSEIEEILKKPKALQILFYCLLYKRNNTSDNNIIAGIYSFKKPSNGFMKLQIKNEETINDQLINQFENFLNTIIDEMFNTTIPFSRTDKIQNCEFCPYNTICN